MNEDNKQFYHAVILAAGSGTRAKTHVPKQFYQVAGRRIIDYTLDVFLQDPACQSITLVSCDIDTPAPDGVHVTQGGATRQESVYKGLQSLSSKLAPQERVLIHDGARAFIHQDDITALLACKGQSATLAKKVKDTLETYEGVRLNRDQIYSMQTPQMFVFSSILQAHEKALQANETYTDDTALMRAIGIKTDIVIAQHYNEKITTPEDIKMAEILLNPSYEYRTGLGFDVHAFETAPSDRKLILCGVEVPHEVALTGHSDADVGLHTITDALLGAVAAGDIGRHFPPSDPTFKNMDSAIFLEKARDIVAEKGGIITNIDLTFMCEAPKITPHAPTMVARVAQILDLDPGRVSIKATTTEKLGFTGRKEGIAAQAVATVKLPEMKG